MLQNEKEQEKILKKYLKASYLSFSELRDVVKKKKPTTANIKRTNDCVQSWYYPSRFHVCVRVCGGGGACVRECVVCVCVCLHLGCVCVCMSVWFCMKI